MVLQLHLAIVAESKSEFSTETEVFKYLIRTCVLVSINLDNHLLFLLQDDIHDTTNESIKVFILF